MSISQELKPWEELLNLPTFTQEELDRISVEEQRKIKDTRYGEYLGSDLRDAILAVLFHREDTGEAVLDQNEIRYTIGPLLLVGQIASDPAQSVVSADLHGTAIIRDDDTAKLFIPGKWLEDPFRRLDQEASEYKAQAPIREQQEVRSRFATEILEPQPPAPIAGGSGPRRADRDDIDEMARHETARIPERRHSAQE